MKNLKKVLAMVLAFACTFSMFAGAKVFEDVPAGSDYSEAITMLSDLGVIQGKDDGKYHPEDTITRAEACAMIARLMTGDPKVSQYVGAQSFSDVQKGSWKDSAIGYCYINGIVIGVGNNKFEPDRAITDAEFVTMVVRAMGYETADMKQNYPFSYMSNAQAVGLLDGTNMVASTDALRGEDAQVIYNALFADYARGAKLVNTTHGTSVESYSTLAESIWGLDRAAVGTWDKDNKDDEKATLTNCKAHTWVVVGADKKNEGNILAYPIKDDETDVYASEKNKYVPYSFKYEGDIEAIKGYQVELWGEGKHGEPTWEKGEGKFVYSDNWTIKAIKTVKGQKAYDYNASMADKKDDNGEIVLGEETLKLESVADNAKELSKENTTKTNLTTYLSKDEYNGEKIGDKKNVEKALNVRTGAQYKLVDWDSDGDIDWVVVDQASYFKVESVNSKRLTVSAMEADQKLDSDKDDKSVTWKLDDLNDEKDYKVKYEVPEGLEEGDVIELTYKVAYDKGEKCEVITATATKVEADNAELDKVSTKDDLELTFDGEVSKIAQNAAFGDIIDPANPDKYADFDDEELGTEFALWKNRNGFIVYSDYATESSNYMMILDTGDGSDKTGDRKEAKADILLADNSVKKDVEFASDLKIDGKNNGDTGYYKEDKGDKDARSWNESLVVGNVYKYWQNEDGVITKMEPMFSADAERAADYSYDESADRLKEGTSFVASLEEADVIFAVTGNYIDAKKGNLYVDDSNVMAVKQSDIPEIVSKAEQDTNDTKAQQMTKTEKTWLNTASASNDAYIAEVDKNGEASAAILGVENFNKFNDASTTVGLVTSVSYDKNDVVEIEVAYKGEVTTLKSAEKVDFDDIVELYNGTSDKGLTAKEAAKLLKDNARYAEITTDADGKLTAVTFMNVDGNKATGHYYEVSRRIITDVEDGNVAYGTSETVYYNNKNLYSVVDRLKVDDKDLADEVDYYTIDGRPTTHADKYEDVTLAIVNGFDGTPNIAAETDSNLVESYINNKFDDADNYYVADLAYKIDGDIVAAFAFEDTLGEVSAEKNAKAIPSVPKLTFATPDAANQTFSWTEIGGADVDKVTSSDDTIASVSFNGNTATVDAKKAGKVVIELFDGDTKVGQVEVVVEDAAIPTYETKVVKEGKDASNTATITVKSGIKTGTTNVAFDGKAVDFNTTTDAATTAQNLVKAINDTYLAYSATSAGDTVTIVSTKDTAFEVAFTGQADMFETTYKKEAAVYGVTELKLTSGVDAAIELKVTVNRKEATVNLTGAKTAAEVATAIEAQDSTFTDCDVTVSGDTVTFTAKGDSTKAPTVTIERN